jgi:hypothetical protein
MANSFPVCDREGKTAGEGGGGEERQRENMHACMYATAGCPQALFLTSMDI